MIYIFDIDGTLADLSHRLHHIQKKPADWDSFYQDCDEDSEISEVVLLAKFLSEHFKIILITGRSRVIEAQTTAWLKLRRIPFSDIYMRREGDHREDYVVKAELLAALQENTDHEEILGVFEDRQQVVDMYRSKGLRVYQVAEGNF